VRKTIVVFLMGFGLLFFFSVAWAQTWADSDSTSDIYETTLLVEPLGPNFVPVPWLEPCGQHFLATSEGTSFPPAIAMFLDRFKGLRFEYDRRLFINSIRVIVDAKGLSPRARLHYQAGWVTADLWVPANELNDCPCLKLRVSKALK